MQISKFFVLILGSLLLFTGVGCSQAAMSKVAGSKDANVAPTAEDEEDLTPPPDTGGDDGEEDETPPGPIDCGAMDAQYRGVIPVGRNASGGLVTDRLDVQMTRWPRVRYNYQITAQAQSQLDQMHGDIGAQLTFGARGTGNWNRVNIPAGTVLSYEIKTSDYNFPIYYQMSGVENPESGTGVIMYSVSKCPGYFISPDVMAQTSGYDHYNSSNFMGDQKFRNCVTVGSQVGNGIAFGVGGNTDYICRLEKNQTYYLNITAGRVHPEGLGLVYPHIGRMGNGQVVNEMSQDLTAHPFGHLAAVGQVGNLLWTTPLIKNREAYYSEAQRVSGLFQQAAQDRVNQCRQILASAPMPRTGRECSGLPSPVSPYRFEF